MCYIYLVILGIIIVSSSPEQVHGTNTTFVDPAVCYKTNEKDGDQCNSCLMKTKASPSNRSRGEFFFNYIHRIKTSFNHVGNQTFSWTDFNYPQIDLSHVKVTLAVWNEKTQVAHPTPGCCSISLLDGQCKLAQCLTSSNTTVVIYTYKQMNVMKTMSIPKTVKCKTNSSTRSTVRYFTICSDKNTTWKTRFNCECAVYDSETGILFPENQTSQIERESSEGGMWFFDNQPQNYQVCMFTMSKGDVMKRGLLANDSLAMDSVVFNRGVFHMTGFSCVNGTITDEIVGQDVNCSMKSYKGSEVFSISSDDIRSPGKSLSNDSFTCIMPWPNGSGERMPAGVHVKCMPQNETFPKMSNVYTMQKTTFNWFNNTMVVFIPLFGAAALMVLICLLGFILRKKYKKFLKETKKVPEELNTVMKDYLYHSSEKMNLFQCDKKEVCQALDWEEKNRILSLRIGKLINQSVKQSESSQISNDFYTYDNTLYIESNSNKKAKESQKSVSTGPNFCEIEIPKKSVGEFNRRHIRTKSSFDAKRENDSGCPISLSSNSIRSLPFEEDSPVSSEISYCLHHQANSLSHAEEDDVFSISSLSFSEKNVGLCDGEAQTGGYWSKSSPFDPVDRFSRYSDDTGCGSESEEDCENVKKEETNFAVKVNSIDEKKRTFFKTTSKDSGVVTDAFRMNSVTSLSDVSEDAVIDVASHNPAFLVHQEIIQVI